jgi:hypothetical protein
MALSLWVLLETAVPLFWKGEPLSNRGQLRLLRAYFRLEEALFFCPAFFLKLHPDTRFQHHADTGRH